MYKILVKQSSIILSGQKMNKTACGIFSSEGKMKLIFAIGDLQYTVLQSDLGLALRGDINMSIEGKGQDALKANSRSEIKRRLQSCFYHISNQMYESIT